MLRFIRKRLYQNGWDKVTYRDLLRNYPLHKLITCQIVTAVMDHATNITFGLPPGAELSNEAETWIRSRHEHIVTNYLPKQDYAVEVLKGGDCVRFHRRDGLPEIPCWYQIDGQWHQVLGIPTSLYAYLPQHLCERLVSLDGKRQDGGKEEWIEYTDIAGAEKRKFVRVELVFEVNYSVTIELLETRELPSDATVWWRNRRGYADPQWG
jgi:hypothetical protein